MDFDSDRTDGADDALAAETERKARLVKRAVAALSEHFDTVQLFVSDSTSEGTSHMDWGTGNSFARQGQVREWALRHDHETRLDVEVARFSGQEDE